MPATDSLPTSQPVWWKRRPLRFGLAAATAVVVVLWGFQLYYNGLRANPVNLELISSSRFLVDTEGAVRVQLVDTKTQKPLDKIPIEIDLVDPKSNQVALLTKFSTDPTGSGPANFRLPKDWSDGDYRIRVTAKAESGDEVVEKNIRLERSWKVMLSTDKPVYQPGQTIHLRALSLRRPDLKPIAGEVATITITDPKGNLVFKQQPKTSNFGIVSADFQLADEVIEGPYAIAVKISGVESNLSVEVKPYVLPKFKIEIATDKPYYRPGETVKGTVKASYFFGKPVVGSVVLDSSPRAIQRTIETDANGEAKFEGVLTANRFADNPVVAEPFTITATVTDSAGQKTSRTVSRNVAAQDLLIDLIPEGGSIVDGIPNRFFILVSTPDGTPSAAATVKIGETTLTTNDAGLVVWEATPKDRVLSATIVATDKHKRTATRTFNFTVGSSNRDFLMRLDRSVFAAGEPMKVTFHAGTSEPIFLDLLQNGQVIRTSTVEMKDGKGESFLDLPPDWFGNLNLVAYRVEVTGQVIRKSRGVFIKPAKGLNFRALIESTNLVGPNLLMGGLGTVSTTSDFRPGDRAKLTLTLLDDAGKPSPGAISLAAVDEAVFHVLEQRPGLEKSFFLNDTNLGGTGVPPPPIDEFLDAPAAGMEQVRLVREEAFFARTTQLLPSVEITSLKVDTLPAKVQQTETRRRNGLAWVSRGWQISGIVVAVLGAVGLLLLLQKIIVNFVEFPESSWKIAFTVWGMILAMVAIISMAPEYSVSLNKFDMVGSRVSPTAGPPKSADWGPKKDDSGAPESEMTEGGVRIRKSFPETLLWKPELITDDAGRVSLEFPLADSITSWRMTASGVNASGQLGGWQSDLVVFQPFFVDVNLPVKLTRYDEIALPLVVSNYLKEAQKVKITLKKADWFETLDELTQELELAPGEVKSIRIRLRAVKVGRHDLDVLASTDKAADAVRRSIEVIPEGRRVEQVVNGTLTNPAAFNLNLPNEAIEGSGKLIVKFYPSGFSQLVEGLEGIFQMPTGCFEQTSSSTYPNILVLDYLKRMNKAMPEIEATARQYINTGYQRLLSFEVPGGGFDWYGHAPANRTLTAYGLMEFRDMARVHSVDPRLIERTRAWLLKQRSADGSWEPDSWNPGRRPIAPEGQLDLARIQATAYIAWAAFSGEDKTDSAATKKYLAAVPVKDITDPYLIALLANALLAVEDPVAATTCLQKLDELKTKKKEGDQTFWAHKGDNRTAFHGAGTSADVEATALAVLAQLQAKAGMAAVKPSLTWLTKQRDSRGTWQTTQATVLALKALVAASQPGQDNIERKIDIALGAKFKKQVVIPVDQSEVMQQFDLSKELLAGVQKLELSESTKGETNFQIAFRYYVPFPEGVKESPFPVALTFDRDRIKVGESIKATVVAVNSNPLSDAPMVLLELPIPVGFVANPLEFSKLVTDNKIARFQMLTDRVLVYLRGMKPLDRLDLEYTLRGVMPVKITASGAKIYEYYDPTRQGVSPPRKLEVLGN